MPDRPDYIPGDSAENVRHRLANWYETSNSSSVRRHRPRYGGESVLAVRQPNEFALPFSWLYALISVAVLTIVGWIVTLNRQDTSRADAVAAMQAAEVQVAELQATLAETSATLTAAQRERDSLQASMDENAAIDHKLVEDLDVLLARDDALTPPNDFLAHVHYLTASIDAGAMSDPELVRQVAGQLRLWIDGLSGSEDSPPNEESN